MRDVPFTETIALQNLVRRGGDGSSVEVTLEIGRPSRFPPAGWLVLVTLTGWFAVLLSCSGSSGFQLHHQGAKEIVLLAIGVFLTIKAYARDAGSTPGAH
jgi:hypothetical protein